MLHIRFQIQTDFITIRYIHFPRALHKLMWEQPLWLMGFLMWFQFSFQQKKPLSSKMQEHLLATYHLFPKLCIPGCPYLKYKIIQPLGLGRGMYFISGIICNLRKHMCSKKMQAVCICVDQGFVNLRLQFVYNPQHKRSSAVY